MEHHQPLRESLFHSVPPFINYVPSSQLPYDLSPGPQYWDQSGWDQVQSPSHAQLTFEFHLLMTGLLLADPSGHGQVDRTEGPVRGQNADDATDISSE